MAIEGLPYKGGKKRLAEWQCRILSEYAQLAGIDSLVDLCGGGGKIAFNVNRNVFHHVNYNEYDVSVYCLMKMIRNKTTLNWLVKTLHTKTATIDNYSLFKEAKKVADEAQNRRDEKEHGFDIYTLGLAAAILLWGSTENDRKTPMRTSLEPGEDFIRYPDFIPGRTCKDGYSTAERTMRKVLTRLQPLKIKEQRKYIESIQITNMDAFDFLAQKKRRDNLLVYIDPPYVNDGKKDYCVSWTIAMHERLVKLCENSKLKIAICYGGISAEADSKKITAEDLPCYQRLLKTWHRYCWKTDPYGYNVPVEGKKANRSNLYEYMLCNFVIPSEEEKRHQSWHS